MTDVKDDRSRDAKEGKGGQRRRSRECATQVLYQLELAPRTVSLDDVLHLYWAHVEREDHAEPPGEDVRAFAEALVEGVVANADAIDRTLQKASQHWKLERMSRVDRNILRLGAYELLFEADVPTRVVLNEAIELAKKFGTEESGAFVNGILDRIAHEARKDR